MRKLFVAIIHHKTSFLDPVAGIEKALVLINEAAVNGVRLIISEESWLKGYLGGLILD